MFNSLRAFPIRVHERLYIPSRQTDVVPLLLCGSDLLSANPHTFILMKC